MDTRALPTARTGPFRSSLGAFIVYSGATRITGPFSSPANTPGWSGILGLWRQASQRAPTFIWFILDSDIFFLGWRAQGEAIPTNNEIRRSRGYEKSSAVVSH